MTTVAVFEAKVREPGPGEDIGRHGWYIPFFQRQKELDRHSPAPLPVIDFHGNDTRTQFVTIVGVGPARMTVSEKKAPYCVTDIHSHYWPGASKDNWTRRYRSQGK